MMTSIRKHQASILRLVECAALALALASAAFATQSAQAQNYNVLYSFSGGADGATPQAGLVLDAAGNLYGTTTAGGASNLGTVFKLDTTGTETVLYSFAGGADGATPSAGLVFDAGGNLYGTTTAGGASNFGTVFKLDTTGTETVLHSFTGGTDGQLPQAGLILDATGNLYGTTDLGGASNFGTVFKLDTAGTETVLHAFTGGAGGANPTAPLVLDSSGNLYGTTEVGGKQSACFGGEFACGVVFKLDTTDKYTVLYTFTGADGGLPEAGLILDDAGNLYGTTSEGGGADDGVVFKLDTTGKETVLLSLGEKGSSPFGGLVLDHAGSLYGTTSAGGASNLGTVFKLDTTRKETVLHAFTGGADGGAPYAGLVSDAAGNLYGTATVGGASNLGVVFGFIPDFEFGTITSSPANATVTAGESVTYTIPVNAVGSFSSSVELTCTSGLPAKASCSAASATPATPASLIISTQANSIVPMAPTSDRKRTTPLTTGVELSVAFALALLLFAQRNLRTRRLVFGLSIAAMVLLFTLAACGGGGGGGGGTGPHAVSYTVTITGTSGPLTHTTTVSLTVSP